MDASGQLVLVGIVVFLVVIFCISLKIGRRFNKVLYGKTPDVPSPSPPPKATREYEVKLEGYALLVDLVERIIQCEKRLENLEKENVQPMDSIFMEPDESVKGPDIEYVKEG